MVEINNPNSQNTSPALSLRRIVSGHFFFHPIRSLAMGHVTRHMFKRYKQTRCQRNIFFHLNFFCFCSIIFYSYAFVLISIIFCWKPYVPIRSGSNGYCILDQNGTVHRTEPLKKPEWIFAFSLATDLLPYSNVYKDTIR